MNTTNTGNENAKNPTPSTSFPFQQVHSALQHPHHTHQEQYQQQQEQLQDQLQSQHPQHQSQHQPQPHPHTQPVAVSAASPSQSILERRKAHRAYTQKCRNKVNSRFEALLEALPTPPPRLNPRSKAEILEYATDTVLRLVARNNKLELSLALSNTPQLEAWLTEQTQNARTVHQVCLPILKLFTIGLEWKGAEVWAVGSQVNNGALSQAWTYLPPTASNPTNFPSSSSAAGMSSVGIMYHNPSPHASSSETSPFLIDQNLQHQQQRQSELLSFLDSAKQTYFETTSNEALAVVYRSGKPAWLSCEYKSYLGFENAEFTTERTRLAATYGISDVLFVPLILYNNVQVVVCFYNMRSRSASGNPALQPQMDPESAIRVATEAIDIIARKFCSIPGVSEFGENN